MATGTATAKPCEQRKRDKAMEFGAINWFLITGVGVALLFIVIAVAKSRNRSSRDLIDKSERATHDLYDEEDRAHRGDGDGRY